MLLRILVLALTLLLPAAVIAQDQPQGVTPVLMLKRFEPTHPERILLTFSKVAGVQPDFVEWAKNTPYLTGAKDRDKDTIINRENNRLIQAFATLDIAEPLIVHTKVHLNDYSTIQEVLALPEFNTKTFFAYSIYGQNVAIVPKGIANFGQIKITKADMEEMLKKTVSSEIVAELVLKPTVADAKEPFIQNGLSYWLLLSDIGEIRLWSNEKEPKLLWMHRADWYKPKENKNLMDLKATGGVL